MSKRRRTRCTATADRPTVDVVTQLETAIRHPHAAAIGAVLGGLVPWFGRTLAHGEVQKTWAENLPLAIAMMAVVVGCGAFSGLSVYKFGKAAFSDPRKAGGFVLALEGVMLVAHGATSTVALVALILINAVANGSVIALAREATCRRQAADARRAASRRKTFAAGATASSPAGKKAPVVGGPPAPASASASASAGLVRWTPVPGCFDVLDAEILS
jgi:hypothetical protein